jgi:glycosyltransferase involved in cell wall biosynthesis
MPMDDRSTAPFYSIVLPVYKESAHIIAVLTDIRTALESVGSPFELILVDDGSPDTTWSVLRENSGSFPMMKAIRLSRNFGKENAMCAGLEMARGDAVIVMDADGQHPPGLLPEIIRIWHESGADIVDAVKSHRGKESIFDNSSALLFYRMWNKLSGFDLTGASDYKLLGRRAVDAYLQMEERNVFFRGMTAWLGFTRAKVPFEVVPRGSGSSNWPVLRRIRLAVDGISGFSALPLQLVTVAGVIFFFFSIIFGVYTLALQLAGRSISGFATVILLLLVIGSLLMISLGIIGIYLARIYEEIKRRPRYVVAQTIEPIAARNK